MAPEGGNEMTGRKIMEGGAYRRLVVCGLFATVEEQDRSDKPVNFPLSPNFIPRTILLPRKALRRPSPSPLPPAPRLPREDDRFRFAERSLAGKLAREIRSIVTFPCSRFAEKH